MKKLSRVSRSEGTAFSLVEMLVAMAVFLILALLIAQIVGQTARSTGAGNRRMEATRAARISLDTLAEDLRQVVATQGSTIVTGTNAAGNIALAFLCGSRPDSGSAVKSRVGGVFFMIQDRPENGEGSTEVPMLCRGFYSVPWDINLRDGLATVFNASIDADAAVFEDVLGPEVFRMEIAYLKDDGTITTAAPQISGTFSSVPALKPGAAPLDLSKIKALIIGVAALDQKTQKLLLNSDPAGLAKLAGALPSVTQDGKTPTDTWNGANLGAFPMPVRQNLRFFQRTIYLQ